MRPMEGRIGMTMGQDQVGLHLRQGVSSPAAANVTSVVIESHVALHVDLPTSSIGALEVGACIVSRLKRPGSLAVFDAIGRGKAGP